MYIYQYQEYGRVLKEGSYSIPVVALLLLLHCIINNYTVIIIIL